MKRAFVWLIASLTGVAVAALLTTAAHATAAKRDMHQVCKGFLYFDDGIEKKGFQFIPDDNQKSLWCDADLSGAQLQQIIKVCKVYGRCRIEGTFAGHGSFGWTKILNIQRLPGPTKDCDGNTRCFD
jgi:hypothetical protein